MVAFDVETEMWDILSNRKCMRSLEMVRGLLYVFSFQKLTFTEYQSLRVNGS